MLHQVLAKGSWRAVLCEFEEIESYAISLC